MITGNDILAAHVLIDEHRTPSGGWTSAQLAAWGVPWPPPRGWKDRLAIAIAEGSVDVG